MADEKVSAEKKMKPKHLIPASEQPQIENKGSISINLTYPYSDKYEYTTQLEKIDLDAERVNDLKTGKGFVLDPPRSIKADVKNQTGIFSNRFGSTISDVQDSFNGKYRCKCGMTRGSIMHGERCPVCGHIVKFYDDDVTIFGWLILKDKYYVIHPNIYSELQAFIGGARLARIIEPDVNVDSDGKIIKIGNLNPKKNDPFAGIGMFDFHDRYDEILDFYYEKYPAKKLYYEDLKKNKNITFTHSIPVFSALLRPSSLEGNSSLKYASTNENFQMMSVLVNKINKDKLKMDQKVKEKLSLLNDLQLQINEVYLELKETLARKKGDLRASIGGQ